VDPANPDETFVKWLDDQPRAHALRFMASTTEIAHSSEYAISNFTRSQRRVTAVLSCA
jgi:hypothetical protein